MGSYLKNCNEIHSSSSSSPERLGSEGEDAHEPLANGTKPPGKGVNFSPVYSTEDQKVTSSSSGPKTPHASFPKSIIKNRNTTSPDGPLKMVTVPPPSNWDPTPPVPQQPDSKGVIETIGLIGAESDAESEVDPFCRMSRSGSIPLEEELAEGSVLSPDEEDDEEDFKVHFVHHGKKVQDNMNNMNHQPDLMFQINELQEAVVAMKGSLNEAVMKLSSVDGSSAGAEVEEVKRKCEGNSAEILKMVLALKTDFSSLRHEFTAISKRQEALQKSIRLLLDDRRLLAGDLSQAGVISQHTRSRLDSSSCIIGLGGGTGTPGSGSHSNDSGVALLLEKSLTAFADEPGPLLLSGQRTSDQDSLPDQPSLLVPASVYDYVAGLSHPDAVPSATNQFFCQDSLPRMARQQQSLHVKEGDEGHCENGDLGVVYDSDSSLTIAANKTINLSTCISQEIKVNDTYSSPHPPNRHSSSPRTRNKRPGRGESESVDCPTERNLLQSRRRRPLLGVSSTKLYQSNGEPFPSSGEKEGQTRYRYIKGDPREAQRYKLAKELVETEKQYCRTLWTIQDIFAEPLKKASILSNKDIATLFPEEVYQLYDKHCFLQHQLKERLTSWKWQPLIGDILARFTDPNQCEVLRLYTNYVNDFPEVLKTFHKLCHTSQSFTEFIKNCLDQPACNGLDLGAFLLTPVQRVPKYILLLKQLLKYTSTSHPDHKLIETVLERLRDFLSRLNDAMEHSFRLVNSSLSPSLSSSTLMVTSSPSKHRCGRATRKSGGPSHESASYSPSNRRNRHARIYQPSSTPPSNIYRSPKRSCSSAGGASSSPKTPSPHSTAGRSASLPRGFTSMSSDSPDSSGDGQESSPERNARSRSESTSRYRLHEGTPLRPRSKYFSLTPARSVTDVATGNEIKSRWEDIASSEPSLVGPEPPPAKALLKKVPSLSSSHNLHALTGAEGAHKLVTWTDSIDSTDESRTKKKTSIKSSIKNIFTFKKRTNSNRNSREEPLYWPSSVIFETSAEASPSHQHVSKTTLQTSPPAAVPNLTSVPVGDFVDEEGNQCSNV